MFLTRVSDFTENVPEMRGNSGQGLVTTVYVIHAGDRSVDNSVAMPSVSVGFLDDAPVPSNAYGATGSQPRAGHINVPEGTHASITTNESITTKSLRGGIV